MTHSAASNFRERAKLREFFGVSGRCSVPDEPSPEVATERAFDRTRE
jgi:hypothetical protein